MLWCYIIRSTLLLAEIIKFFFNYFKIDGSFKEKTILNIYNNSYTIIKMQRVMLWNNTKGNTPGERINKWMNAATWVWERSYILIFSFTSSLQRRAFVLIMHLFNQQLPEKRRIRVILNNFTSIFSHSENIIGNKVVYQASTTLLLSEIVHGCRRD